MGNASYSLTFNGLYSKDQLFGSEQIFAGGAYSVRGFRNVSVGGDKGFTVRNELRYDLRNAKVLTNHLPSFIGSSLNKISIIPFLDYGYVKSNALNSDGYNLSGTGLKLAFTGKRLNADITYSKMLKVSSALKQDYYSKDGGEVIYANLSFGF